MLLLLLVSVLKSFAIGSLSLLLLLLFVGCTVSATDDVFDVTCAAVALAATLAVLPIKPDRPDDACCSTICGGCFGSDASATSFITWMNCCC